MSIIYVSYLNVGAVLKFLTINRKIDISAKTVIISYF